MHLDIIDRQLAHRLVARLRLALPPRSRRVAVLMTGFSTKLDLALARVFAEHDHDILLCSDNDALFHEILPGLRGRSPDVRIERALIADDDPDGPVKLRDAVDELGLRVRIVLANTHAITLDNLPCLDALPFSPFLAAMAKSGKGRLLISNSSSESQSRVLDQSGCETSLDLAMGLWQRWQGRGIAISALMVGAIMPNLDTAHLASAAYNSLIFGSSKVFTSVTMAKETEALSAPAAEAA